jgi:predicted metal-dependent hydrolase
MYDAARQLNWLDLAPEEPSFTLRRSPRARRLSVRVHRDASVEVIAPPRLAERSITEFLARHRDWILARRETALRQRVPPQAFPPQRLLLPAFGETWHLHLAGGQGSLRVRARQAGLLEVSGHIAARMPLRRAMLSWLLRHSRERLEAELGRLAQSHGFSYRAMSLRRQRTRWGSCSTRGTISLNVCLAFQPAEVMRYLLIHELAHTRHMNHSAAFWSCVSAVCPDWQRLDRALLDGWRHVPHWVFERGENRR